MEDRASTMTVLLDISAARKEVDDRIASYGEDIAKPSDLPDGLKPQLRALANMAVQALLISPSWANTLYAAAIGSISVTENDDVLRQQLIEVAQIAVSWIEVIDERNANK